MSKYKPRLSMRHCGGIPPFSDKDFFKSDFKEKKEEEDSPAQDEEMISPARRKELRKEMDESMVHFFGGNTEQIKNS